MNRKERKQMEKKLGIAKYKQSLTRAQRFELMAQNIAEGKKKQERLKEEMRIQSNAQKDAIVNKKISDRALELMLNDGLDYYSAQEKAKEEASKTE